MTSASESGFRETAERVDVALAIPQREGKILVTRRGDGLHLAGAWEFPGGKVEPGETPADDRRLEEELLADEKERAEHVMLVDLGRNDLGRVCQTGSVQVQSLMHIERYSHVMHIVSEVEGDLVRAAFPAGTVSGAPKIRAMEIIADLEDDRRGPYAGAVGYFGHQGDLDMCITIRTIVVRDGRYYVQAGAGIVADSIPSREYEETLGKARALVRAVEIAERGL